MSDDSTPGGLPMLGPNDDPSRYRSMEAKQRFAVSKFYGMGSDGEWSVPEIAEEMDVHPRTVRKYLHHSDIGKEVREVLATTEAEWRLDMALDLRREIKQINEMLTDLKQRKKAIATDYDTKTVHGTPTGDRNIKLPDYEQDYELKLPVPTDYETVTDYGPDIQKLQKEKRQYWKQIAELLGIKEDDKRGIDEAMAGRHDEVKIVEVRTTDDPYPEAEPVDMAEGSVDDLPEAQDADFEEVDEE